MGVNFTLHKTCIGIFRPLLHVLQRVSNGITAFRMTLGCSFVCLRYDAVEEVHVSDTYVDLELSHYPTK